MLNLTAKHMEALALDRASGRMRPTHILMDGDVMYLNNECWMLVLTRPEDYVDRTLLEWLKAHSNDTWKSVDWRLLATSHIDYAQEKFLPHRSRKYLDMRTPSEFGYTPVTAEKCRQIADLHIASVFGDNVDLSEMYVGGRGRPVYASRTPTQSLAAGEADNIHAFWFSFDNRVVAVSGIWLDAFHDLGFRVLCPRVLAPGRQAPVLGLAHSSGDIFGFVMPLASSGVTTDRQGRELYGDAAMLSWADPQAALDALGTTACHDLDALPETVADLLADKRRTSARQIIGVLRWHGMTDGDIEDAYYFSRPAAMVLWHGQLLRAIHGLYEELQRGILSNWRRDPFRREVYEASERIRVVQSYLGPDIDLGELPELLQTLPQEQRA